MSEDRVSDDEVLYRRIPLRENLFRVVNNETRAASQAFADPNWRPSVDRAILRSYNRILTQLDVSDSVVSLVTGEIRNLETVVQQNERGDVILRHAVEVEPVPIVDDPILPDNPAHAEVYAIPPIANARVFKR